MFVFVLMFWGLSFVGVCCCVVSSSLCGVCCSLFVVVCGFDVWCIVFGVVGVCCLLIGVCCLLLFVVCCSLFRCLSFRRFVVSSCFVYLLVLFCVVCGVLFVAFGLLLVAW